MASPNTGVITQTLGTAAGYSATGKHVDSYPSTDAGFTKSQLWASPASGNKLTFAGFFRIPDQADNAKSYRNLLIDGDTNIFFAAKDWYNFTDQGDNTNRFYIQVMQSGNGYGGFTAAEDIHGIDSGEWFALMFSIDYSASSVPATVECWIQRKGDSTATDIAPSGGDLFYNANGPKTFDFDNNTSNTVLCYKHSNTSYDDYYGAIDISEIYVTDEYVDWSDSANRLKFVDSSGEPVGLGSDGSDLTGTAAKIYLPDGDGTSNAGTGGNFTQVGTIPNSTTSPSSGGGGVVSNLAQTGAAEFAAGTSSGIVTQTLPFITQRATNAYQAVGAQTLPFITQTGTATYEPGTSTGLITQYMPSITQIMTADFFAGTTKGPITQTLWPVVQTATGTYLPGVSSGDITQTINGIEQALNGTHQRAHFGTINQALDPVVQTATATFVPGISSGVIGQDLQNVSQALTGHYEVGGSTGWITLQEIPFVTQALTGLVYAKGTIVQTLPLITQSLDGTFAPDISTGSISQTLQAVVQVLSGSRWRTGAIDMGVTFITQSLDANFTAGISTGDIVVTLKQINQSASAHYEPGTSTGTIFQELPFIRQSSKAVTFILIKSINRLIWEQYDEELIWEVETDELIWER